MGEMRPFGVVGLLPVGLQPFAQEVQKALPRRKARVRAEIRPLPGVADEAVDLPISGVPGVPGSGDNIPQETHRAEHDMPVVGDHHAGQQMPGAQFYIVAHGVMDIAHGRSRFLGGKVLRLNHQPLRKSDMLHPGVDDRGGPIDHGVRLLCPRPRRATIYRASRRLPRRPFSPISCSG